MRGVLSYIFGRRLTVVVMVVLLASSSVIAYAVRNVVRDQERRLLSERSHEIVALLSTSAWTTRTMLNGIGSAALDSKGGTPAFAAAAKQSTDQGGSVGVAQLNNGAYTVIDAAGKAVSMGQVAPLAPSFIQRVLTSKDFVSEVVPGPNVSIVTASRIAAPVPTIAFALSGQITRKPFQAKPGSPYQELNVAFYADTRPNPAALLIQYNGDPGQSKTRVAESFLYGGNTWLVVSSARQPLVGSFAARVPWMIMGVGVLLALLLGTLTEVLIRRRGYAMRLVEERTRTLREAQQAAEAANKAKSEFISRMSHELRTPLNAVLGFGQVLELYEDITDFQRKAVSHITTAGRHLLDLINEILDLSQVESGRLTLAPEAVPISAVVTETIELLEPVAAETGVTLVGTGLTAGPERFVFADPQRLKQVLLNLIGNAIKYNRPGGSVTVRCTMPTPRRLRLLVTDTGPGIGEEQIPRLFTPFERLGAERTAIEGTGMGLALSKRLVEAMEGTLGVESVVGTGSTFWVELQVVEGEIQPEVASRRSADRPSRPTVLYIEDHLSSVKLVEQVLATRPGIELLAAMQGSVGLEVARSRHPILILLDVNLPDVDGETLMRQLHADPLTTEIPVIVVSADATQRQIDNLKAAGATDYLAKPIDVPSLLSHIDAAAAAREDAVLAAALR